MMRSPINREDFGDDDELALFEERAAEQRRKHELDSYNEPTYLPADELGFETEAWTAGGPEEEDA